MPVIAVECPELETLEKWLEYWKEKLRLQAWNISIQRVTSTQLGDADNTAECWPNYQNRTATIKVSYDKHGHGDYYPKDLLDWETTVVHELLHCQFDPGLAVGNLSREACILYEQAISATSQALVALRYTDSHQSPQEPASEPVIEERGVPATGPGSGVRPGETGLPAFLRGSGQSGVRTVIRKGNRS